jgi:hypothetical protein
MRNANTLQKKLWPYLGHMASKRLHTVRTCEVHMKRSKLRAALVGHKEETLRNSSF